MHYRPQKLIDFRGNENIKDNLSIFIKSSLKRGVPLDHCLIYGLPGTGKTSLALIIATELNKKIKIVQGNSIQRNSDIINTIMSVTEGDVLFIDEIHAINLSCIELLYSIMEDFAIDINLGKDFNTKPTRINVPKFTLIGATTMLGKLPQPIIERFGIIFGIKEYDANTIAEILHDYGKIINLQLQKKEYYEIALNSKNIPRNAIRILKRINDFKQNDKNLTVSEILEKIEIFKDGLTNLDIQYLNALSNASKPCGIKSISQILNVDPITIEIKIEPYLLSKFYISKTNLGRIITTKGEEILSIL